MQTFDPKTLGDIIDKIGFNTPFLWNYPTQEGFGAITSDMFLHYLGTESQPLTYSTSYNERSLWGGGPILDWYEEETILYDCCKNCDEYNGLLK